MVYMMRYKDTIKWVATIFTLLGGLATSLSYDPLNIWLLNIGALLFLTWACMIKEKAMITVNVGMLSIYIIGLIVRV